MRSDERRPKADESDTSDKPPARGSAEGTPRVLTTPQLEQALRLAEPHRAKWSEIERELGALLGPPTIDNVDGSLHRRYWVAVSPSECAQLEITFGDDEDESFPDQIYGTSLARMHPRDGHWFDACRRGVPVNGPAARDRGD